MPHFPPKSVRVLAILLASLFAQPAHASESAVRRVFKPKAPKPGPQALVQLYDPRMRTYNARGYGAMGGEQAHASAAQYEDLRNAGMELLKRYSPDKYFFVGVGRDPTPLIAFLQELGDPSKRGRDVAINFSASSNEAGRDTPAVMAQYVEKLIPAEVRNGKREIVFVDVTSSGRGLNYWVPKISEHLPGKQPVQVAFADPTWSKIKNNPQSNVVISTRAFPDVANYYTQPYEDVTDEFGRHSPGINNINELDNPLPGFDLFKGAIRQRMVADPVLDQFLASIGIKEGASRASGPKAKPAKAKGQAEVTPPPFVLQDAGQTHTLLTPQNYQQLRDTTKALLKAYPYGQFQYLFAGRSAAPLMAMMRRHKKATVDYLPFDGMRKMQPEELAAALARRSPASLTVISENKPVVLVQRTDSGKLLAAVQPQLENHLKSFGLNVAVHPVALANGVAAHAPKSIDVSAWPDVVNAGTTGGKLLAPLVRQGKSGPGETFVANSNFQAFEQALDAHVRADKTLGKTVWGQ